MIKTGTVRNGVVVLDDPADFQEGTVVQITTVVSTQNGKPVFQPTPKGTTFADLAGIIDDEDIPEDLSTRHDHYRRLKVSP